MGSIRKKQATESRNRILQAAVSLFARQGYGNTGLRELAASAEVNLAMINYFFGSKKKLLKEILDVFFSGYLEIAQKEMKGTDELPVKLHHFIHSAVRYFSSHRDYLLVTIAEMPHDDPEITKHKAIWGSQMAEIVGRHLPEANNSDGLQPLPPVIFCSMLTSIMASRFLFTPVMNQVQPELLATTSTEEYADIICTIFLQGANSILSSEHYLS